MHILHIVNSYSTTQVYMNLVNAIDAFGVEQTVIVPLKKKAKKQLNVNIPSFKNSQSNIVFLPVLKKYHRFFYKKLSSLKQI